MAIDLENGRRTRGELEQDIKRIADAYVTGELELGEGETLTPYRIAKAIQKAQSLDAHPSPGAVTATLKRWNDLGFAVLKDKPLAFEDYTEEGREVGLTEMKAKAAAARKAATSSEDGEAVPVTEERDEPVVPVADEPAPSSDEDEPLGSGEYPVP